MISRSEDPIQVVPQPGGLRKSHDRAGESGDPSGRTDRPRCTNRVCRNWKLVEQYQRFDTGKDHRPDRCQHCGRQKLSMAVTVGTGIGIKLFAVLHRP